MRVPVVMAHEGYGIKKENGVRDKYVCCLHPCCGRTTKWSLFELNRHREKYHDAGPICGRLRGKQASGKWPQRSKTAHENALKRERLDVKKKCDKQETTYRHRLIKEAMATEGVYSVSDLSEESQRNIEASLNDYKSRREERERATLARIQLKEKLAIEAGSRLQEEIVDNVRFFGSTSKSPEDMEEEDEVGLLKGELDDILLPLNNPEASVSGKTPLSTNDDMSEEPERSVERLDSDGIPGKSHLPMAVKMFNYGSAQRKKPTRRQKARETSEKGKTSRKRKAGSDFKGELSSEDTKRTNVDKGVKIADCIPGRGTVVVGSKIKKDFDGRIYSGEIVGYELLYKVKYEDGDFEELTWEELQPRLVSTQGGFLSK